MIHGHGVDVTEIARIEESLARFGDRFVARTFCESEIAYCGAMASPAPHYAARFAAKEAVLKALGTGLAQGIRWTDVEILKEHGGRPTVALYGSAAALAAQRGLSRVDISLSHTNDLAIAQVVALWRTCPSAPPI